MIPRPTHPAPAGMEAKLTVLEQIYAYFDELTGQTDWACRAGCAQCCTVNVSLTTLEGVYLYRALKPPSPQLLAELAKRARAPRYRPRFSLNDFAWRCAQGRDTPEEHNDPRWGACPLLEHDLCTVYTHRPFGCRCMLSNRQCGPQAEASLDEWQLTINHLFLQVIEHLDCPGWTGNLTDILLYWHHRPAGAAADRAAATESPAPFPANQPARALLIPPEHRRAAGPVLQKLQQFMAPFQES